MDDKLKYFEVEESIGNLKNVGDKKARKKQLDELLSFLGANPIEKVNGAFKAKYHAGILDYLGLAL